MNTANIYIDYGTLLDKASKRKKSFQRPVSIERRKKPEKGRPNKGIISFIDKPIDKSVPQELVPQTLLTPYVRTNKPKFKQKNRWESSQSLE